MKQKDQIFISYVREDLKLAKRLCIDLKKHELNVWIDFENLRGGEVWDVSIKKAIKNSRFFVILNSNNSVNKVGFGQNEIKVALEEIKNYPPNKVYIIPIRVDTCEIEYEELKHLHWIDMFPNWNAGIQKIIKSVGFELKHEPNANNHKYELPSIDLKVSDFNELAKAIDRGLNFKKTTSSLYENFGISFSDLSAILHISVRTMYARNRSGKKARFTPIESEKLYELSVFFDNLTRTLHNDKYIPTGKNLVAVWLHRSNPKLRENLKPIDLLINKLNFDELTRIFEEDMQVNEGNFTKRKDS